MLLYAGIFQMGATVQNGIGAGEQGRLLYVSIFSLCEDLEGENPVW